MTDGKLELPAFGNPPVVEVAIGVQFAPIEKLQTAQLGLLWAAYRDRFPKTEQHPPIAPAFETFDALPTPPEIRFEPGLPVPRCWFLNALGTQLIQVQQDRFLLNWRRASTEEQYPRYRQMRQQYREEFERFTLFVSDEKLGSVVPNQCEFTYINHILSGQGWERLGQLNRVTPLWGGRHTDEFLKEPEDIQLGTRYVIYDDDQTHPIGRLHVSLNCAVRRSDRKPLFVLKLTARGRPEADGMDGAFHLLDRCHEWAVRGFASVTSDSMHKLWERKS
jgi:uncharacterized protein (TIGR04255 family)